MLRQTICSSRLYPPPHLVQHLQRDQRIQRADDLFPAVVGLGKMVDDSDDVRDGLGRSDVIGVISADSTHGEHDLILDQAVGLLHESLHTTPPIPNFPRGKTLWR
jgi:hypothetical protein